MKTVREKAERQREAMLWISGIGFILALFIVDDAGSLIAGGIIGLIIGAYASTALPDADHDPNLPTTGLWAGLNKGAKRPNPSISGSAWTPKKKSADRVGAGLPVSLWDSGNWPPPEHAIDNGGGLSFSYADANGEVTERRIISWKEDPEYDHCFTGWCTDREEPRTFRIDRVQSWG